MSQIFTDHMNQVDKTNIHQVYLWRGERGQNTIPGCLSSHEQDESLKILVYQKPTHTDQYLHLTSHDPISQKLGVLRTLLDRCCNLVKENKDREAEEQYIKEALTNCDFPDWTRKKVKDQIKTSKEDNRKIRKELKDKNKGLVVIPYIQGISESFSRVLKKHNVSTAMSLHMTVSSWVVHPKEKKSMDQTTGIVYKITCSDCDKAYIGETSRMFENRTEEHKEESDEVSLKHYTRGNRKRSEKDFNKSAITDSNYKNNHTMSWEEASIVAKEANWFWRGIRGAICIRREEEHTINHDRGQHDLSNVYNPILKLTKRSTARGYSQSSTFTRWEIYLIVIKWMI